MEKIEKRKVKILINSAGGNASKNSKSYRVSLPSKWMQKMDIAKDCRAVELSFNGESIVIRKISTAAGGARS